MAQVTLDNLAVMVQQGFTELRDELISRMDARFDKIEDELRYIRNDIRLLSMRLDAFEKKTNEDSDVYRHEIVDLRRHIQLLEKRLVKLEKARG